MGCGASASLPADARRIEPPAGAVDASGREWLSAEPAASRDAPGEEEAPEVPPEVDIIDQGSTETEEAPPEVDILDRASLVAWLKWADVPLLRAEFVASAPLEVISGRRQELPAEAFCSYDELRDFEIHALSYAWQSAAHPDPRGLVAAALGGFAKSLRGNRKAFFWDHKCLYQHKLKDDWDPKAQPFEDAVLARRSPMEERNFRRALGGMQWIYFHTTTYGIILPEVPTDARNPTAYWTRGWPLMESMGLGLSSQTNMIGWDGQVNTTAAPPVALTVADFEAELAKREFTSQGDKSKVLQIYENGFNTVTSKHNTVEVALASTAECDALLKLLPAFPCLEDVQMRFLLPPCLQPSAVAELAPALWTQLSELNGSGCAVRVCKLEDDGYFLLSDAFARELFAERPGADA